MTLNKFETVSIDGLGRADTLISSGAQLQVTGHTSIRNANVSVDGVGSIFNTDSIEVQDAYSNGNLTASNGGIIAARSILLSDYTGFSSFLNIGSEPGTAATGAGEIITDDLSTLSGALVNFNHTNSDYIFSPSIHGTGGVDAWSGTTTLTGQNDYSGPTGIKNGATLIAGGADTLSAASAYQIDSGGTLDLNGFSHTLGDTTNGGLINLAGTTAGTVLTVDGNYTGNNGTLLFGTELGDDTATSDRLVVTGDATGTTNVRVSNLGGRGAETLNGIELIDVLGSADSSAFVQQGRIVAGAYDYRLVRGDRKWYLSSKVDLETGLPIIGDGDGDGNPGTGDGGGSVMVLRPESAAYSANLATASTLFDTRISDRQGTYYFDPVTGEGKYTSLWLRTSGDHNRFNTGDGQLSSRANSFVTMLGGDVAASDNARFGLMAGYGNSKSNTHSKITGYRAKGQINGYTTGVYGTWFADGTDEKGLWADSTLQYSWFNNSVDGEDVAGEHYKSGGLSASVSTGYVIPLGRGERTAFFLQPQARVGWSGIKADDHTERNGTLVQSSGQDNVSTSLGVKGFMKGHSSLDDSTGRQFGLFTEANWIHNSREYAVRMDDVSVSQSGSRNIAEARVGIDGALGNGVGIKGSIGQQVGDKGWSDTSAAVSVSYRF